jgi:hypothetical protein
LYFYLCHQHGGYAYLWGGCDAVNFVLYKALKGMWLWIPPTHLRKWKVTWTHEIFWYDDYWWIVLTTAVKFGWNITNTCTRSLRLLKTAESNALEPWTAPYQQRVLVNTDNYVHLKVKVYLWACCGM